MAAILLAGLTDEYKPLILSFEAKDSCLSADEIKLKLLDTQFSVFSKNSSKDWNNKNHKSSNCPSKKKSDKHESGADFTACFLMGNQRQD